MKTAVKDEPLQSISESKKDILSSSLKFSSSFAEKKIACKMITVCGGTKNLLVFLKQVVLNFWVLFLYSSHSRGLTLGDNFRIKHDLSKSKYLSFYYQDFSYSVERWQEDYKEQDS